MAHIVLLGAGGIGLEILDRWIAHPAEPIQDEEEASVVVDCGRDTRYAFSVVEPVGQLRDRAVEAGARGYARADQLPPIAARDTVVITSEAKGDITQHCPSIRQSGALVLSEATVEGAAPVETGLECTTPVVRVIPIGPTSIRDRMVLCSANSNVTDDDRETVRTVLSAIGTVMFVNEDQIGAASALCRSAPAYAFLFIESLFLAAKSSGLDEDLALRLAQHIVYNASRQAIEGAEPLSALRRRSVKSNDVAAAGLNILLRPGIGLTMLVQQAVAAAANRVRRSGKNER